MPDAFPRASKSIRLDAGTVIRLDDDAFAKAGSCPTWLQWCERAPELAEWWGLPGLSKEQAGRWLLSMDSSPMELWRHMWERTHKTWSQKPGGGDHMNEICNELKKRETLRDEILEHVRDALAAATASQEELLLEDEIRAAIAGARKVAAKKGKTVNRGTGPKKVQDFWRENTKPEVKDLWQKIMGYDVPTQADIKKFMDKKPRGRLPKN
jgi:hypothetical protein